MYAEINVKHDSYKLMYLCWEHKVFNVLAVKLLLREIVVICHYCIERKQLCVTMSEPSVRIVVQETNVEEFVERWKRYRLLCGCAIGIIVFHFGLGFLQEDM